MNFNIEYKKSSFKITTSKKHVFELGSILETLGNKTWNKRADLHLRSRPLNKQEYVNSLRDIALFIDESINNGLLSNLRLIRIIVNRYDDELINVFGKISRLIANSKITSLLFGTKIEFVLDEPDFFKFQKQEMSKLLSNFLCGQTTVTDLSIDSTTQLPDAHCLGHFEDVSIKFSAIDDKELELFIENFSGMLNYNQNIKSLEVMSLPVGFLDKILDALSHSNSLKFFSMVPNDVDYTTSESIANMIANNKSITRLYMEVPYEYKSIIEALKYNETLRELILEKTKLTDDHRLSEFLSDLNKMLDTNFTLTDITFPSVIVWNVSHNKHLIREIEHKTSRNKELLKRSRFAKIKPIF